MKILVIVESPAKIKAISKYLAKIDPTNTYTVMASFGHVRDLKKKELSVDVAKKFAPTYDVVFDKVDKVQSIKDAVKKHNRVLFASDPDREGESIAWHLWQLTSPKSFKRISFNEITEKGLREALQNPRAIDQDLVDAQQARRVLDRIVGFKLTPLLWKHFTTDTFNALSAGRVQSAALKIVVDREKEIQGHVSSAYWTLQGDFTMNAMDVSAAKYYKGTTQGRFTKMKDVQAFLKAYGCGQTYTVRQVKFHVVKEKPPPPFITSTLQQEAHNKLGLSIKSTMMLAQTLYEKGYITYMRTDAFTLSEDARAAIHKVIVDLFGKDHLEPRTYQHKNSKNAQEAHEAIRPTKPCLSKVPDTAVDKKARELYQLIWRRTIASQMTPAEYDEVDVQIAHAKFKDDQYYLGKIKELVSKGFLKVMDEADGGVKKGRGARGGGAAATDTRHAKALYDMLSGDGAQKVKTRCTSLFAHNTWTSAPSRYNESMLIKVLEKEGIGRPSTYATILNKLYDKQYVLKQNDTGQTVKVCHVHYDPSKNKVTEQHDTAVLNEEKGRLVPTQVGLQIDGFLREHFSDMIEAGFTAAMEEELDTIAEGKKTYAQVLSAFWKDFSKRLNQFAAAHATAQPKTKLTSEQLTFKDCIVRVAKYGPVIQTHDKTYVGLKPYLTLTGKNYMDMEEQDVSFLVSLPKAIPQVAATHLYYGRYGFYIKKNNDTYPIPYAFRRHMDLKNKPWELLNLTKEQLAEIVNSKKKALQHKQELAAESK